MQQLYNYTVKVLWFLAQFMAPLNLKLHLWVKARKSNAYKKPTWEKEAYVIWMHCASLGEFEQGRPVIEMLKENQPNCKILLTFFSPSGYVPQSDYPLADMVCYLPLDLPHKLIDFINTYKPKRLLIIKYEFWPNLLLTASKMGVEIISISSVFNENQIYFKSYGRWFLKALKKVDLFLVQNEKSKQILTKNHITNVHLVGDTRFDRVLAQLHQKEHISKMEAFCRESFVVVAGSTWHKDEALFLNLMDDFLDQNLKLIIAPHQVGDLRIKKLIKKAKNHGRLCLFSDTSSSNFKEARILIVDSIGWLSKLYRYGDLCYIGGGFTKSGIHNVLEAAVYKKPTLFGPNYKKYNEAVCLVSLGAAFVVNNAKTLSKSIAHFYKNPSDLKQAGEKAYGYINQQRGAVERIKHFISSDFSI